MKKCISLIMIFTLVFSTMVYAFAETTDLEKSSERSFKITVTDQDGNEVENAKIYLYSFLDQKIVARGNTGTSGKEEINYFPEQMENVESRQYGDYLVYVEKDGFIPAEHNLTKYYIDEINSSQEEREAADRVNEEQILISLSKESGLKKASIQKTDQEHEKIMNKVQKELIETNRLSKENPICVLRTEDFIQLEKKGVVTSSELRIIDEVVPMTAASSLRNIETPVGTFHVSKQAKLNVTLYTSDSLKIEVGAQNTATGALSVSGSRERGFETTSYYAEFTTTGNTAKKVYYTMADYEEWTTVQYYGNSYKHIGIKQINGGTNTGKTSTCGSCGATYSAVTGTAYGTYMPVAKGSHLAISQFRNSTVSLSTKVGVSGGFSASLGVTRKTGASAKLDYAPKAGYKLKVYNKDTKTWHCTHAAA